jgi:gamma-glutamyltranspeptidase/glutathione hydrolase
MRAVSTASEGHAAEAASALLAKGNAVDAVVAGVFAAAAASRGVLLGPVQMLFGGAGLGLRAVDGRTRQPGKGAPRPRGFTESQAIAPAARVGVPALPAALVAAHASSGSATLAQVMAPAIAAAHGARKDVLKRVAQRGPSALSEERFAGEVVAVCGRVAGGLVTRDDLEAVLPQILPTTEDPLRGPARLAAFVPWLERGEGEGHPANASRVQAVAAADHRGLLAVACYELAEDGVAIDALELLAPFTASPVLRGETRVKPGAPSPAAAPIALVRTASEGALDVALAVAGDADGEGALRAALHAWSAEPLEALTPRPPYAGAGTLLGVTKTKRGATLIAR